MTPSQKLGAILASSDTDVASHLLVGNIGVCRHDVLFNRGDRLFSWDKLCGRHGDIIEESFIPDVNSFVLQQSPYLKWALISYNVHMCAHDTSQSFETPQA